jgi:hypothetical protein
MGWGIEYTAYLSRVTKEGLDSSIRESDDSIRFCKEKILLWCGMNLNKEDSGDFLVEFNENWDFLLDSVRINIKSIECKESLDADGID